MAALLKAERTQCTVNTHDPITQFASSANNNQQQQRSTTGSIKMRNVHLIKRASYSAIGVGHFLRPPPPPPPLPPLPPAKAAVFSLLQMCGQEFELQFVPVSSHAFLISGFSPPLTVTSFNQLFILASTAQHLRTDKQTTVDMKCCIYIYKFRW